MKRIMVGMHEAKTTLSELVKQARAGQEVVISSHGEPVARIVPYRETMKARRPGRLAGQITIEPDFDAPPPGFAVFAE